MHHSTLGKLNKASFQNIVNNPVNLKEEDISKLEELVASFPYCQTAHILLAKAAYDQDNMLLHKKMKKASLYTSDRKNLKHLMRGLENLEQEVTEEYTETIEETLVQHQVETEEKTNQEEIVSNEKFTEDNDKVEEIESVQDEQLQEEPVKKKKKSGSLDIIHDTIHKSEYQDLSKNKEEVPSESASNLESKDNSIVKIEDMYMGMEDEFLNAGPGESLPVKDTDKGLDFDDIESSYDETFTHEEPISSEDNPLEIEDQETSDSLNSLKKAREEAFKKLFGEEKQADKAEEPKKDEPTVKKKRSGSLDIIHATLEKSDSKASKPKKEEDNKQESTSSSEAKAIEETKKEDSVEASNKKEVTDEIKLPATDAKINDQNSSNNFIEEEIKVTLSIKPDLPNQTQDQEKLFEPPTQKPEEILQAINSAPKRKRKKTISEELEKFADELTQKAQSQKIERKVYSSRLGAALEERSGEQGGNKDFHPEFMLEYLRSLKTKKYQSERSKVEESKLIDKFIKSEPSISQPQKSKTDSPIVDYSKKSQVLPSHLVTENLAKIKAKQGNIKQAINIYKQLILKFPEKRSYFASEIEKIKKD